MKEWNDPYNPFNSTRVLMHREHLEALSEDKFLPPIMVDIDPSNKCNFDCIWCNAYSYIHKKKNQVLPKEHLIKIADFCKEWGIISSCVSGGGEPYTNPHTDDLLLRLHKNGIQNGVISNGSLLRNRNIEVLSKTCRWVGISVDAATRKTFSYVKGNIPEKIFDKVINNIEKLCKQVDKDNTECDVCYKFLLHPINSGEIYEAARIAKDIGVRDFHLRPVGWDNIDKTQLKDPISFDGKLENINEQVIKAMDDFEDDSFRVFGIRHKFDPSLKRKISFSKCRATPLLVTFGADGNYHLCFDIRGKKDFILCSHYPNPEKILEMWGTEKHKEIIDSIDINKCPRCTFGPYNEIIEKVFIEDKMCRRFI